MNTAALENDIIPAWMIPYRAGTKIGYSQAIDAWSGYYLVDGSADDLGDEDEERLRLRRPAMVAYARRTGTRRNLEAMKEAGWRLLISAQGTLLACLGDAGIHHQ